MRLKLFLLTLLFAESTRANIEIAVSLNGGASYGSLNVGKKKKENDQSQKPESTEISEKKPEVSFLLDGNISVASIKNNVLFGVNGGFIYHFSNYEFQNVGLELNPGSNDLAKATQNKTTPALIEQPSADATAESEAGETAPNARAENGPKKEKPSTEIASLAQENTTKSNHSHIFYAGPIFGYNFSKKFSIGTSLNYVFSSTSITSKASKNLPPDQNYTSLQLQGATDFKGTFYGVMPGLWATYAASDLIFARIFVGYAMFFKKDQSEDVNAKLNVQHNNLLIVTMGISFKAYK